MPPLIEGTSDRYTNRPGGLPPVPYRNHNGKLTGANSRAHEPWNSRAIATEVAVTRKWRDQFSPE